VACNAEVDIDGAADGHEAEDREQAQGWIPPENLAKTPDDPDNSDAHQRHDRSDAGTPIALGWLSGNTRKCHTAASPPAGSRATCRRHRAFFERMVRSGRLGMIVGVIGVVSGGVAMLFLVLQAWVLAATLAGVFLVATFAATALLMRADPEELKKRQKGSERYVDAWARGMASASGAWRTRSRHKRSAGTGDPPADAS
jgi:hypothetical protein